MEGASANVGETSALVEDVWYTAPSEEGHETNFTSTPFPDVAVTVDSSGRTSFDFASVAGRPTSVQTRGTLPLKKLSVGGISHITPDTPRLDAIEDHGVADSAPTCSRASVIANESIGHACMYLSTGIQTANLTTRTAEETVPMRNSLTLTCHNIRYEIARKEGRCAHLKNRILGTGVDFPTDPPGRRGSSKRKTKVILNGVSAYFPPGMNAIMGPSGGGKTSLLSILALRNKDFSGNVRINGNNAPKRFARLCGYSTQDDILNPALSVREHIWYSLCLRRGSGVAKSERNDLVDEIISSLQLQNCCEKKVGDTANSTISGGERKRTSIGMELAASPKVIILDEPTSALDSSMSKEIIRILKKLASKGRTIIFTIHQPSYAIYRDFDTLTLLAKGRLVYLGSPMLALEHFTSLGFPREPHHSPPDFFLDILYGTVASHRRRQSCKSTPHPRRFNSVKEQDSSPAYMSILRDRPSAGEDLRGRLLRQRAEAGPSGLASGVAIPKIIITRGSDDSYGENNNMQKSSTIPPETPTDVCFTSMTSHISAMNTGDAYVSKLDATTCEGKKEHSELATWLASVYACSEYGREIALRLAELENKSMIRDELQMEVNSQDEYRSSFLLEFSLLSRRALKGSARLCVALIIMNVVIGMVFGALYYHRRSDEPPAVQNRLGMFFYLAVHGLMVPSMITAKSFVVGEKSLFEHEKKSGYYRAVSYCVSRVVVLLLARLMSALTLSLPVYWLAGLKPTGDAYLLFMTTCFTSGLACDCLCLLSALGCSSFAAGRSLIILYMSLTSVFAGFLLNLNTAFPWLAWIKHLSITRYCYLTWVIIELSNRDIGPCETLVETRMQSDDLALEADFGSGFTVKNSMRSEVDCGMDFGRKTLEQAIGDDTYMVDHLWLNHVVLLLISLCCLFLCYLRMRRIQ